MQVAGAAAIPGVLLGSVQAISSTAGPAPTDSHAAMNTAATASEQPTLESPQDKPQSSESSEAKEPSMQLGAFSVSLAVKDLEASRKFYEKFGFKAFAGNPAQKWQILKNGDHVIGLFQGMFKGNILTFNPGWDQSAQQLPSFTDVRDLQRQLKAQGVKLTTEADETTKGPASFTAVDPDGNTILVDQHV
jgi:catechol 2,3-dioxygenase-like lactoylglutathione lyase family enzyme